MEVKRGTEQVRILVTPALDSVKNVFGEVTEKRYMIGVVKAEALVYEKGLLDPGHPGGRCPDLDVYLADRYGLC